MNEKLAQVVPGNVLQDSNHTERTLTPRNANLMFGDLNKDLPSASWRLMKASSVVAV